MFTIGNQRYDERTTPIDNFSQDDGETWSNLGRILEGKLPLNEQNMNFLRKLQASASHGPRRIIDMCMGNNPREICQYGYIVHFLTTNDRVFGNTLMHHMAKNENLDEELFDIMKPIFELARSIQFDFKTQENNKGVTPLDIAFNTKNKKVLTLLLKDSMSPRGLAELAHSQNLPPEVTGKIYEMGVGVEPDFKKYLRNQKSSKGTSSTTTSSTATSNIGASSTAASNIGASNTEESNTEESNEKGSNTQGGKKSKRKSRKQRKYGSVKVLRHKTRRML
jgi:hypothetical protein